MGTWTPGPGPTSGDDTFVGDGTNETVDGAAGTDTLSGGGGSDTLIGGDGDDILYAAAQSPAFVLPYASNPWSAPVLDTGSEVDTLVGGNGSDRLFAGYGDNVDGGSDGSFGDALYISFQGASSGVTANFTLNTQTIGGGTITGVEYAVWIQGSEFDDDINSGAGSFGLFTVIDGMGGNDHLVSGQFAGTVFGGDGNDFIDGTASPYLFNVYGGSGDDTVYGSNGANVYGGDGNDILNSYGFVAGGAGNDHIFQSGNIGTEFIAFGEDGDDEIQGLSTNGSTIFGGNGADTLSGGDGNDHIYSSFGFYSGYGFSYSSYDAGLEHDVLAGGWGNDFLYIGYGDSADGGSGGDGSFSGGIDTLYVSLAGAASGVTLNTAGIASGGAVSVLGGAITGIEYLANIIGSAFGDTLSLATQTGTLTVDAGAGNDVVTATGSAVIVHGEAGDDTIIGSSTDDVLDGGAGNDALTGGAGNDTYYVDSAGDVVTENANQGTDIVVTTAPSYTLGTNVENLTFAGTGNFTATGNTLANVITSGVGNDILDGAAGDDTIYGGDGGDRITAGAGNDFVFGGNGDDFIFPTGNSSDSQGTNTYDGGAGTDSLSFVNGQSGSIVADLQAGTLSHDGVTDTLVSIENVGAGFTGSDQLSGDGGANILYGGGGNDILVGRAGNDTLIAGRGVDQLTGGVGDDLYVVEDARVTITELVGEGTDTVLIESMFLSVPRTIDLSATANIENYRLTRAYGSGVVLYANDQSNVIQTAVSDFTSPLINYSTGGGGGEVYEVHAGGGDDVVTNSNQFVNTTLRFYGDAGNDTLTGSYGNDVLDGGDGSDILNGAEGDDTLLGGAGNDTLSGSVGTNTLSGGGGDDTYNISSASDVVVENASEGSDLVRTALLSYALSANVEDLTFTGSGDFSGTGNALSNVITGGIGNDILDGGAGNDTLVGDLGNDIYVVDNVGDLVTENASAGTDEIRTTLIAYTLGGNVEKLTFTGSGDFSGSGNGLSNVIIGGAGNDTIDGGIGADTMAGGLGNDTYFVDDVSDVVTENASAGIDEVRTTNLSHTLGVNVENLTFTGSGNFTGNGNALANAITGGSGNDTLDGGAGSDALTGGAGNDTYSVDNVGDIVIEASGQGTDLVRATAASFTLGANVENLIFIGSGDFTGTGNALANVITGGSGNDTLYGDSADTLIGALGNDTFVIPNLASLWAIVESAGQGSDTILFSGGPSVALSIDLFLYPNLENVTSTYAAPLTASGTAANNTFVGGAGNDLFYGGAGADVMTGGAGNDFYLFRSADFSTPATDTVNWGAGDTLRIEGVQNYQIAASSVGGMPSIDVGLSHIVLNGYGSGLLYVQSADAVSSSLSAASGVGLAGSSLNTLDWSNAYSWRAISETYNASLQRTNYDIYQDNGTSQKYGYDLANQFYYSSYYNGFDAAGRQNEQGIFQDDGGRQIYLFDAAQQANWLLEYTIFDTAGAKSAYQLNMDSGASQTYFWDTKSQNGWSSYFAAYDTQNRMTFQSVTMDDGTSDNYGFDPGNLFGYARYSEHFDDRGNRMNQITYADDGSHLVIYVDPLNQQNWYQIHYSYNAANVLVSQHTYYDDGSFV